MRKYIVVMLLTLGVVASCRKDEGIIGSTSTQLSDGEDGEIKGFFMLNEGNMGSNKATLDYFDYTMGVYSKNIYAERNPSVARELGDTGNDLKVWGGKLYAVINGSNFVEVMDVESAEHITQISVPNCRYISFKDNYAYVSSYAGAILDDPNARLGYVAKIDTATLSIVDTCSVGYQPEVMAVVGDKLYVANSGGYMAPDYDSTISVIDLESFEVVKTIEVAINLHNLVLDNRGCLWVSSRGDYYDVASKTYVVDTSTDEVVNTLHNLPNLNMALRGDSLYVCSTGWSYTTESYGDVQYAIVNTQSQVVVDRSFITDGTESNITTPYEIAVNPNTGDIFISDAKDYTTPGSLNCYSQEGVLKWRVTTGDIPASIAFSEYELKPLDE